MKIEFMRIENWRSFYRVNEIVFSVDPIKNVTLVRAENGVGKTSLLAALNWCLFGILPPDEDFQNPKNLLNNNAKIQDKATHAKIEVEFEHRERHYKASRTYDQVNERMNSLKLVEIVEGVERPLSSSINVDRFINSVLPREMAPHFFFYGEATSKYADEGGGKAFGEAVKNILGATIAGMALADLERSFKDYNREAADNSTDEAVNLQGEIDRIEQSDEGLENSFSNAELEEAAAEKVLETINKQLLGSEVVKKDQLRRNQLTQNLTNLNQSLQREIALAHSWFHNYGTALLSQSFISEVTALLDKEDTRKKIPGPFNAKFVNEILEDKLCICGRSVSKGSGEESHIKSMLGSATDEMMINRVLSTNIALGRLNEKGRNGWRDRARSESEQARLHEQVAAIESELIEISDRLKNNDIKSIVEKEEARSRAKSAQRAAIAKQATITLTRESNRRQIASLIREQEKLVHASVAAQRYVKRAQLAGALSSRLKNRLETEELFARIEIKKKIDKIVSAFMRKNLTVEIDENYRVIVKDEDRNHAANSKGEKQMLGLAFTGAIADFARDRQSEGDDILLSGAEAPLVVDSPFGHLDTKYRQGVAKFLPSMASQVILLLSSSQASQEVLDELADKIGSQYVLSRFERSDGGSREIETVDIDGKTHNLTQYNQEFTGTRIVEVH